MIMALCLCACGDASEVNNTDNTESVNSAEVESVSEETTSDEQPVEEETVEIQEESEQETADDIEETIVEEESQEQLSDEEWFKSLNLDTARFMIFNDVTGERKLLEEGEQYTLLEGDVLAFWYPLDWKLVDLAPIGLYTNVKNNFDCLFLDLYYDHIGENSELTLHVQDANGNDVYTNVFLSK